MKHQGTAAKTSHEPQFVEFTSADAPRLAAFHKRIELEISNPQIFEARDEVFFASHPSDGGWTVGYIADGEIVATTVLWGDLTSFRESWYVPYESTVLPMPAAWWGGWAIESRNRGTNLSDELYSAAVRSVQERGFSSLIGAFFPLAFAAHSGHLNTGRCTFVGRYNDKYGWNYLRSEAVPERQNAAPREASLWVSSTNEDGITNALRNGYVGVAARRNADGSAKGFDVGFKPIRP